MATDDRCHGGIIPAGSRAEKPMLRTEKPLLVERDTAHLPLALSAPHNQREILRCIVVVVQFEGVSIRAA